MAEDQAKRRRVLEKALLAPNAVSKLMRTGNVNRAKLPRTGNASRSGAGRARHMETLARTLQEGHCVATSLDDIIRIERARSDLARLRGLTLNEFLEEVGVRDAPVQPGIYWSRTSWMSEEVPAQ